MHAQPAILTLRLFRSRGERKSSAWDMDATFRQCINLSWFYRPIFVFYTAVPSHDRGILLRKVTVGTRTTATSGLVTIRGFPQRECRPPLVSPRSQATRLWPIHARSHQDRRPVERRVQPNAGEKRQS